MPTISKRLFSTDSAKAIKAQGYGYVNAIHYLAPSNLSGIANLCSHASPGCIALCLGWFSGQAGMVSDQAVDSNKVRESRITKARQFMHERTDYMRELVRQISNLSIKARKSGFKLCVRLNGSSDIAFESIKIDGKSLFDWFPLIDFVDYTKNPLRFNRILPANYHLTFSRSETNEATCLELLAKGVNVAIVFATTKPATWNGFEVIDGDKHDLRQLDPKGPRGVVIALTPKGRRAKADDSGFVVRRLAA